MKKSNPVILGVRLLFSATGVAALTYGIYTTAALHQIDGTAFITALTALISMGLTFAPGFAAKKNIIAMPIWLQVFISLFTTFAMFFGEILKFYDRFIWWDTMLHLLSGFMCSALGFLLFVSLNRDSSVRSQINPAAVVLFTLCFSIACGAVWEIFEFAADSLLGMNMQRWQTVEAANAAELINISNFSNPGLIDTMKDIICDIVGSLISMAVILPLARYDSQYTKSEVSSEALLEEFQPVFSVKGSSKPAVKSGSLARGMLHSGDSGIKVSESHKLTESKQNRIKTKIYPA